MVCKKNDPVSGHQVTTDCRSRPEDGEADSRDSASRYGAEDAGQGRGGTPVPVGTYVLAALIILLALYLLCQLPVGSR